MQGFIRIEDFADRGGGGRTTILTSLREYFEHFRGEIGCLGGGKLSGLGGGKVPPLDEIEAGCLPANGRYHISASSSFSQMVCKTFLA